MKKLNTMTMSAVIVGIAMSFAANAAEPIVSDEARGEPISIPGPVANANVENIGANIGAVAIILYDCNGDGFLSADCGETVS